MDHRIALLERALLQSMDSSLASQSGLADRLSSGLQNMRQGITEDKANQVTMQCFQWSKYQAHVPATLQALAIA